MSTENWEPITGPLLPKYGVNVLVYSEATGEWAKARRTGNGYVHEDAKPFRHPTHWRALVLPDATGK